MALTRAFLVALFLQSILIPLSFSQAPDPDDIAYQDTFNTLMRQKPDMAAYVSGIVGKLGGRQNLDAASVTQALSEAEDRRMRYLEINRKMDGVDNKGSLVTEFVVNSLETAAEAASAYGATRSGEAAAVGAGAVGLAKAGGNAIRDYLIKKNLPGLRSENSEFMKHSFDPELLSAFLVQTLKGLPETERERLSEALRNIGGPLFGASAEDNYKLIPGMSQELIKLLKDKCNQPGSKLTDKEKEKLAEIFQKALGPINLELDKMASALKELNEKNQKREQELEEERAFQERVTLGRSSISLISQIVALNDPVAARRLSSVGEGTFQSVELLHSFRKTFTKDGVEQADKLISSANLVMGLSGIAFKMVSSFGPERPSPEMVLLQEILTQVKTLGTQIQVLRAEMTDRFNRIDYQLVDGFQRIENSFKKVERILERNREENVYLTEELNSLADSIQRLDSRIQSSFENLAKLIQDLSLSSCFALPQPSKREVLTCLYNLSQGLANPSAIALYTLAADGQPSLDDRLEDYLTGSSRIDVSRSFSSYSQFAAQFTLEKLGHPNPALQTLQNIPNVSIWIEGVDKYVELLSKSPEAWSDAEKDKIREQLQSMLTSGERIKTLIEALSSTPPGSPPNQKNFFLALVDYFDEKREDFGKAYATWIQTFSKDHRWPIEPFQRKVRVKADEPAEAYLSTLETQSKPRDHLIEKVLDYTPPSLFTKPQVNTPTLGYNAFGPDIPICPMGNEISIPENKVSYEGAERSQFLAVLKSKSLTVVDRRKPPRDLQRYVPAALLRASELGIVSISACISNLKFIHSLESRNIFERFGSDDKPYGRGDRVLNHYDDLTPSGKKHSGSRLWAWYELNYTLQPRMEIQIEAKNVNDNSVIYQSNLTFRPEKWSYLKLSYPVDLQYSKRVFQWELPEAVKLASNAPGGIPPHVLKLPEENQYMVYQVSPQNNLERYPRGEREPITGEPMPFLREIGPVSTGELVESLADSGYMVDETTDRAQKSRLETILPVWNLKVINELQSQAKREFDSRIRNRSSDLGRAFSAMEGARIALQFGIEIGLGRTLNKDSYRQFFYGDQRLIDRTLFLSMKGTPPQKVKAVLLKDTSVLRKLLKERTQETSAKDNEKRSEIPVIFEENYKLLRKLIEKL